LKINFEIALKDRAVKKELQNYLYYAANIKLERLIAYSLCKYFKQNGHNATLEKKKVDLTIDDKRVELKFNFELDVCDRLQKELRQFSKEDILLLAQEKKISPTWSIIHGVSKDILKKQCDYFIWAISERNYENYLRKMTKDDICIGYALERFSRKNIQTDIKDKLDNFASYMGTKSKRKFRKQYLCLDFKKPVKTNLHFLVLDFT
jgi:hypothetical protein